MSDRRELATVTDYDTLIAALRARADELNVARLVIDETAGLQSGYTGKLLGAAQIKTIGRISMGPLLGALGLALVVVEDPEAAARAARMPKRRVTWPQVTRKQAPARIFLFTAENAREMGARRWLGVPERKREILARRAARARW